MKGLIIHLALLLFIRSSVEGQTYQYLPLIDSSTNKEWASVCCFPVHSSSVTLSSDYLVSGDTVINGVLSRLIWYSNINTGATQGPMGAIYEDSSKRVYIKF